LFSFFFGDFTTIRSVARLVCQTQLAQPGTDGSPGDDGTNGELVDGKRKREVLEVRRIVRSLMVAMLPLAVVVMLAVGSTMTTAVQLTTTALIIGSTFVPNPSPHYMTIMSRNFINPFYGAPDRAVPVHTPAQFWPLAGVNPVRFDFNSLTFDESVHGGVKSLEATIAAQPAGEPLIVLGYSQSTRIASIAKQNLVAKHGDDFDAYPDISFSLVANLGKPNGGILQRGAILGSIPITIPIFGITFGGATATNSPVNPNDPDDHALKTKDITVMYDGVADHPVYLNPLTLANAVAGFLYYHHLVDGENLDIRYQGSTGDTDYYIIPTEIVPILVPLANVGVPRPVLLALDEPLRVMIETTGFRRDIPAGQPTPYGLVPPINPVTFAANLLTSVPVGLDDAYESMGRGRPFGTEPSGPYGVGGPPLPDPPSRTTPASGAPKPLLQQADPVAEFSDGDECSREVGALPSQAVGPPARRAGGQTAEATDYDKAETAASEDAEGSTADDSSTTDESSTQEVTRTGPLSSIVRGPLGSDPPSGLSEIGRPRLLALEPNLPAHQRGVADTDHAEHDHVEDPRARDVSPV
jgi:hypothetical protein